MTLSGTCLVHTPDAPTWGQYAAMWFVRWPPRLTARNGCHKDAVMVVSDRCSCRILLLKYRRRSKVTLRETCLPRSERERWQIDLSKEEDSVAMRRQLI